MSDEAKPQRNLYMTTEVATQLHEEKTTELAAKMKERAAKEEALLIQRRAKQEQQLAYRAGKRSDLECAKTSDAHVAEACDELEVALARRVGAKSKLVGIEKELKELREKSRKAWDRVSAAKDKAERYDAGVANCLGVIDELKEPADPEVILAKSQHLKELYSNSNDAWEKIQKAIRKREPNEGGRDRSIRKRAKGLLDD